MSAARMPAFPLVKHGVACWNRTDDLFITRVVRTAWACGSLPNDQHEQSTRVRSCARRTSLS